MKYLSDLNWWKQFALNVGGVLTAFLAFLSILNIQYHWLTANSINAVVTLIIAIGSLFVGSLATIINTYITSHSKAKATEVAIDYAQEQAISEDAERAKIEAIVNQVLVKNTSAVTTPSTTGPVDETDKTAN